MFAQAILKWREVPEYEYIGGRAIFRDLLPMAVHRPGVIGGGGGIRLLPYRPKHGRPDLPGAGLVTDSY